MRLKSKLIVECRKLPNADAAYGDPRATNDIDVVIEATQEQLRCSGWQRSNSLLTVYRDLNDLLLDRVGHQLRFVVDIQLAHQVELMRFHRLHTET